MFSYNQNFYPTPKNLAAKIISKVKGYPKRVLDPEAGKGDLIEAMQESYSRRFRSIDYFAIEIDTNLQMILRGKKIKVLDSDFLAFQGQDKFDLIIGNPPFDTGHHHLLKAIDIMYRGQIIFILNAETLKNPYSKHRKLLVQKLNDLGAEIEYIKHAFLEGERKTGVEVALINLTIENKVEEDLFKDVSDKAFDCQETVRDKNEVSKGKDIGEMVAHHNEIVRLTSETIVEYYRKYNKISRYVSLNIDENRRHQFSSDDLTTMLQDTVNEAQAKIRKDFWLRTLQLPEVRKKLTEKKKSAFQDQINDFSHMAFTERNIHSFLLNLAHGFTDTVTEAVLDLFDKFTVESAYHEKFYTKNIHYFNGWKTNSAFKVGPKIIIPVGYDAFMEWDRWSLHYKAKDTLNDIDIVMNYFDASQTYISISDAIQEAFEKGETKKIESTYFSINCHKKGTIHLTFKNMDVLRRFNVCACKGKGWLPEDYNARAYTVLLPEEKAVVDSFETEKEYNKNLNSPLFPALLPNQLLLAA